MDEAWNHPNSPASAQRRLSRVRPMSIHGRTYTWADECLDMCKAILMQEEWLDRLDPDQDQGATLQRQMSNAAAPTFAEAAPAAPKQAKKITVPKLGSDGEV